MRESEANGGSRDYVQAALVAAGISVLDIPLTPDGAQPTPIPPGVELLAGGSVAPEDHDRFLAELGAVVRGEKAELDVEYRESRPASGEVRWHLCRGSVVRDEGGAPVRFVGTRQDVTRFKRAQEEARRAEEEAQRSAEALRLATRLSGVQVWSFELASGDLASARATFVNVLEPLGYALDEVPAEFGSSLAFVIVSEDQARVFSEVQACLDGKTEQFESEYRVRHKDGSLHWNLARGVPIRDRQGRAVRFAGASVDVTRLEQVEENARVADERLELAAQLSGFAVVDLDLRGGGSPEEIVARAESLDRCRASPSAESTRNLREAVLPEYRLPLGLAFYDAISGKAPEFHLEYRARDPDGAGVHWRLARGKCFFDASGAPIRYIGVSHEIQRVKAAEEEARRAVEQLRLATDLSGVAVWGYELDGGELSTARSAFANDGVMASLGYDAEDVPPSHASRVALALPLEDQPRMLQLTDDCIAGKVPQFDAECRFVHKDGSIQWKLVRGIVRRDATGRPLTFMGTAVDVTQLKQTQEELQRVKERLEKAHARVELAMRGSDIAVYEADFPSGSLDESRWTFFNMWEPLGHDNARMPVRFADLVALSVHAEDRAAIIAQFEAAVRTRTPDWYAEHRVLHREGSVRWRLSRGTLVFDAAGLIRSFTGTEVDVTRLKQIENELELARQAAEAANRAKDEFLANVSHEIRTPMNAILGMTELALDSATSDHQRQLLSTVRSAAKNLLTIINDLLDFSKIEAGKLVLDRAQFSLRAAVSDTLRALAVRAHRKGLELICRVRPDVPDALEGDAGRLRQVLMNLVGNAIKFTPHGEVEVDIQIDASDAAELDAASDGPSVALAFSVRDTGIGIALDKQAAIFRAFEQVDASTTRNYGGTGLGLTISVQLAALMGGNISVESAPGRGSTFRFTARFARASSAEAVKASLEPVADRRVLIVDDNETNRQILEEWLSAWRMRPEAVGGAAAALAALERAYDAGAPFQLVLLDARMPDMDGATLAGQIRRRWGAAAPRLILLSSDDSAALASRARENGVLASLLKPLQQSELLEAIGAVLHHEPAPPAEPARALPSSRSQALRVLVAEDNELNIALLDALASRRGHRAEFARDGRVALRLVKDGAFDLMLLDLHMPELDGFEVVRNIREHERETGRHLPIIALTARTSEHDRERCLAAGMDDFLSKPIDAAVLWDALDRVLVRWPPAGPPRGQSPPGLLDARAILRAFDGQVAVFEKLRGVFRQNLPGHVSKVHAALREGDFVRLRAAAHQLVGTVATFSTLTAEVAAELEDAAHRQEHERCAALAERVTMLCDELLEATATLSLHEL